MSLNILSINFSCVSFVWLLSDWELQIGFMHISHCKDAAFCDLVEGPAHHANLRRSHHVFFSHYIQYYILAKKKLG